MAAQSLTLYDDIRETHRLSLNQWQLRRLFKLPKRKGTFVSVELVGAARVNIVFETTRDKSHNHNI